MEVTQGGVSAQLTRFLPLGEASPAVEEKEPRWSEFPGAREGSRGRKAVHGGGSGGGGRRAEGAGGERRASAKEEGHKGRGEGFRRGWSMEGFAGERRRRGEKRGGRVLQTFPWVFTRFGLLGAKWSRIDASSLVGRIVISLCWAT